jgi:hypothetical protein
VEQTLDMGGQRHSALIEDGAGEAYDVEGRPPVDEYEMPSAPRNANTSSSAFSSFGQ